MAEFKVIETQEELNEVIKERIEREKAKRAEQEESYKKEIESLKAEITARDSTITQQNEKLQGHDGEVAKLTEELNTVKLNSIKHKIAHEKGLPYELANRLTGRTEDELMADAESLKKFVGTKPQAPPLASTEVPPEDDKKAAYRDLSKRLQQK